MPWHLEGTYFENCSCEMIFPCTTSGGATRSSERCRVVMAFHIDRGHVEALDVSGVTVVVVIDTPATDGRSRLACGSDHRGHRNGRAGLIELASVFSGQRGGPMALLAPLFSEMLGVESAPIEYVDDGRRHTVKVGDTIDVEIEDYVAPGNPTDEIERLSGMLHPASTLTNRAGDEIARRSVRAVVLGT